MTLSERLRAFTVLNGFTLGQLSALGSIGEERSAEAGHEVFREGDEATELLFLLEGKLTLRSRDSQLAEANAPNLVGEMGVLRRKPRLASAVTATRASWLAVEAEDFRRLVEEDPALGRRFFENLSLVLMAQLEKNNLLVEFLDNIRQ